MDRLNPCLPALQGGLLDHRHVGDVAGDAVVSPVRPRLAVAPGPHHPVVDRVGACQARADDHQLGVGVVDGVAELRAGPIRRPAQHRPLLVDRAQRVDRGFQGDGLADRVLVDRSRHGAQYQVDHRGVVVHGLSQLRQGAANAPRNVEHRRQERLGARDLSLARRYAGEGDGFGLGARLALDLGETGA